MASETAARDAFVDLVRWLASWTWPVDEAAARELPEARGWTLVHQKSGGGGVYETGLTAQRSWASFRVTEGVVGDVDITTAFFDEDDPGRERALVDSFAEQVAAVTEVLGQPRSTKPGVNGSALWDLPNGAMLDVGRTDRSCSWEFTSPEYAEVQRDLGR